jgi:hypothetical protein
MWTNAGIMWTAGALIHTLFPPLIARFVPILSDIHNSTLSTTTDDGTIYI